MKLFNKAGKYPPFVYEASGCSRCGGTGYRGRTLIHEHFFMDKKIAQLIAAGKQQHDIHTYLKEKGTAFLLEDGLKKVMDGITTLTEIETVLVLP